MNQQMTIHQLAAAPPQNRNNPAGGSIINHLANRRQDTTQWSAAAMATLLARKTRPGAWLAGLVLLAGASTAMAGDTYWWRGTSSTWGTASNWSKNAQAGTGTQAAPPGNNFTDSIAFNANNVLSSGTTCKFGNNESVLGVIFNNTKGSTLQQNSGTKILTIGGGGITVNDAGSGSTGTDNVGSGNNLSVTLAASQAWANNSSGSQTLSIGTVNGTASTPVTLTLGGSNTGANAITGIITDGASSGTISILKSDVGTWQLGNANAYSGSTTINGGTLTLNSGSSINSASNISIAAGGTFDVSAQTTPYTLPGTSFSASGNGTTVGSSEARIIGPAGGAVSLGSQGVTLAWGGGTSGTDTTHPCVTVSQGQLTLNTNAFTINGSTLGVGTYRLIQVGDGSTGTIAGSPNASPLGTAIDNTKINVVSVDGGGNVILTVSSSASPTITAPATLAGSLVTIHGTASAAQSVAVSGQYLTADITATAASGFDVASDGATFGGTATFSQSGGNVSGTLYVRLAATKPAGNYDSQTVATLSSSGATSANVASTASGNTVAKADSSVTAWPTAGALRLGNTLASSTLSGGSGSPTGTFDWTSPTSAPVALGTQSESVTFTPGDANYNTTIGTVSVLVQGGDGTWILDGNGNWSGGSNWQSNAIADGAGSTGTFTPDLSHNSTVTIDSTSRTLGIMNVGSVSGRSLSFDANNGAALIFDNGSAAAQLTYGSSAGNNTYFYGPILLNGSLNITNSNSRVLYFANAASVTDNASSAVTITNNGGGNGGVNFGVAISNGTSGGIVSLAQSSATSALTLGGTNTYTGGTTVSAGTLNFSGFTAQPSSGTLAVSGGAIVNLSNSASTDTWPKATVTGAGTLNLPLNFSGIGVVSPQADMSGFSGLWNISGTGLVSVQSPFVSPASSATINVGSGTTLYLGWLGTTILGCNVQLNGADDGEGFGQLRVENNNHQNGPVILKANSSIGSTSGTGYIGGVISDGGLGYGFTKAGAGSLTLSATNTYTGATTVSNGTLLVEGSLAAGSAVTVNGGTLGGSGTIGGSVTVVAGSIAPGTSSGAATGLLTVSGDANLAIGSLAIDIDDTKTPKCDTLAVGGALDITNATLHLAVTGTAAETVYVIASYGSLTAPGTFASVTATGMNVPADYSIDYNYNGEKKIALVKAGSTSPYETWAGAGVAFTADANSDGVANGLAWILGAASPSANGLAVLPTSGTAGGNLVLTFDCLSAANRGAALLKVQYSKDLGITDLWTAHEAAVPGAVGISDVGNVHFVATTNGDLIHIVATIPASGASASGSLFGRLTATEN